MMIVAMGALSMAGCGAKTVTEKTAQETSKVQQPEAGDQNTTQAPKIKVGISLPTQTAERWVRDKDQLVAELQNLGAEAIIQIANEDAGKQESQCENLISQGIDVLILAPHDAKSAANIVNKAHQEGIPVISYDRLIMDSDVDLYISFDNEKVGEIQGKFITNLVPKGNYVVLAGDSKDNNATLFKKGAMKYIQPLVDKGDIKIVFDQPVKDWQPAEALKLMENALTANANNIQAVLAPNDGTAGACVEALAAQKLDGLVPITGQDAELQAAKRIIAGTQSMTVFKDTRLLAIEAAKMAVKMANKESIQEANAKVNNNQIDVPSVLLEPMAVTKDNIEEALIDSGYLKAEDLK